MNAASTRDFERLSELLADEAAAALSGDDARELAGLLERTSGMEREQFMQAAALAQVAFLRQAQRNGGKRAVSGMPAGLRDRLASQGEATALRHRGPAPRPGSRPVTSIDAGRRADASSPAAPVPGAAPAPGRAFALTGWALAAALAVAFFVVRGAGPLPPGDGLGGPVAVADLAAARAALVRAAPDVLTLPWAPPTAPGYEQVRGDVVWSESRQEGYLRLANMPVNDPGRTQYQLWIVDPERDTHPVDGGVFNIGATGEVIVPIQAKLRIIAPTTFAITAERPGGVVVSAGPLLVVASS